MPPVSKTKIEDDLLIKKLGERVKSIRLEKGLSLEQVGKKGGKDRQSIHRLERGEFNPSYIYLTKICKGLDIDITELLKNLNNEDQ